MAVFHLFPPLSFILSDQLPVPCHQGLGRDDFRDLSQQFPAQFLRLGRKPAALVIAKSNSPAADLFAKNSILFQKVVDGVLLMLVHPSSDGDDDKSKWIQTRLHEESYTRRPRELPTNDVYRDRVVGPYGVVYVIRTVRRHLGL